MPAPVEAAGCPVPEPGRRACERAVVWRRPDGLGFCALHARGHVHLEDELGHDRGWWRLELAAGAVWLHDDAAGALVFAYPTSGGRWSLAGIGWELDYGPASLSRLLEPVVACANRLRVD